MRRAMAVAGVLAFTSAAGNAAELWTGCYQRVFDAAALKNNPRLQLRVLGVQVLAKDSDLSLTTYPAKVRAAARSGAATYVGEAICISSGGTLRCQLDNGDGQLLLTRTADGLRVENGNRFYLHEQGGTGEVQIKSDRDNRSFSLAIAPPAACTGPLPR